MNLLKSFAILVSFALLLQGCVVYSTTTLEHASEDNTLTKIIHSEGRSSKYKFITKEETEFYGITKKSGELVKNKIDQENIKRVKVKNKSASTLLTVGTIILPVGLLALSYFTVVQTYRF